MATQVHEAIRTMRHDANISLRTLAARLGVSPATLSAIETGKAGLSVARAQAIADALDIDLRALVGGTHRRASDLHERRPANPNATKPA